MRAWDNPYSGVVYRMGGGGGGGGKHCFLLIMRGLCSNNALYWEVFHLQCLSPFDT